MLLYKGAQRVLASGPKQKLKVLALHEKGRLAKRTVLAVHACTKCDTQVLTNKLLTPNCPVCASTLKAIKGANTELTISAEDMRSLSVAGTCDHCDSTVRSTASFSGVNVHCIVCSGDMTLDNGIVEDEEETDTDVDFSDPTDSEMEDGADESDTDDSEIEDDISLDESDIPEDDSDIEYDADESDMSEDETDEEDEPVDDEVIASDINPLDPAKDVVDPTIPLKLEEDPEKDHAITAFSHMAKWIKNPKGSPELLLASNEDRWHLFVDDKHIATAFKAKAKKTVQPFFNTDKFQILLQNAIEGNTLETTMPELGFEPVNTEIPVDTLVKDTVDLAVTAATRELKKQRAELRTEFERCVGIATVGTIKGVLPGSNNPLREGLIEKLTSLRVRNAQSVADSVLSEHAEPFMREIISQAITLLDKDESVKQEMAKVVSSVDYRSTTASEQDTSAGNGNVFPFMSTAETYIQPEHKQAKSMASDVVRGIAMRRHNY